MSVDINAKANTQNNSAVIGFFFQFLQYTGESFFLYVTNVNNRPESATAYPPICTQVKLAMPTTNRILNTEAIPNDTINVYKEDFIMQTSHHRI